MSTLAKLGATAALGVIVGRLCAEPQIRKLRTLLRVTQHIAGHDRLTRLPNRHLATQLFTVRLLRTQPTVVALVDLDRFKAINDTHGHHAGDDLLRVVSRRLATAANAHGGTAARLGGDEFLLLLPMNDSEHTTPVVDILHTLARPTTLVTDNGAITTRPQASAGIAVFDGVHGTFDTILHHADIALHHAKQQRGTHRTYHPDLRMPHNAGRHGPRLRDQRPSDGTAQTDSETTS